MEPIADRTGMGMAMPGRAVVVAETLARLKDTWERPEELAHDARNMVTALELYCHLLEEPGVLSPQFRHYGGELRLVAAASRRLVDKLGSLDLAFDPALNLVSKLTPEPALNAASDSNSGPESGRTSGRDHSLMDGAFSRPIAVNGPYSNGAYSHGTSRGWDPVSSEPITNLAAEIENKRNLLAALAGPPIQLTYKIRGAGLAVWLTREDLTRVLVNLVKNAVEAMPEGGNIAFGLDEFHADDRVWLVLTLEDDGPGIPESDLETIFDAGHTTRSLPGRDAQRGGRRGLGLSISRSILDAAGGRIYAANRPGGGARFEIELPTRILETSKAPSPVAAADRTSLLNRTSLWTHARQTPC